MVRLLARVIGVGIETADMLVQEVLVTQLARPARRGALRGPHGLARRKRKQTPREGTRPIRQRSGAAGHDPTGVALSHVPEGQRAGAVVSARTENARGSRKTMIVALARKLLIALWRFVARWRGARGCRSASRTLKGESLKVHSDSFGPVRRTVTGRR